MVSPEEIRIQHQRNGDVTNMSCRDVAVLGYPYGDDDKYMCKHGGRWDDRITINGDRWDSKLYIDGNWEVHKCPPETPAAR